MKDHDWGVIDINLLAHLPSVKGQPVCFLVLTSQKRADSTADLRPIKIAISLGRRSCRPLSGTTSPVFPRRRTSFYSEVVRDVPL